MIKSRIYLNKVLFFCGFNVVKKVSVDVFEKVKGFAIGFAEVISNVFKSLENFINGSINAINGTINKIKNIPLVGKLFKDFNNIESFDLGSTLTDGFKNVGTYLIGGDAVVNDMKEYTKELKKILDNSKKLTPQQLFEDPEAFTKLLDDVTKGMNNISNATKDLGNTTVTVFSGIKDGMKSYFDSIKSVAEEIQGAVKNAFQGMEDALVKFVMTGKLNFAEFTRSVLADLTRIAIRQAMLNMFGGIFPFLRNAQGNAFGANGVIPYAKGGVVNSPTVFPFKNGVGLMGEAGAEAILPLKRGRSGNLGVEASGSSNNIVVNVDASGTEVQGDDTQSSQLGKLIGLAVQQELVKQQRAGGLLSRA